MTARMIAVLEDIRGTRECIAIPILRSQGERSMCRAQKSQNPDHRERRVRSTALHTTACPRRLGIRPQIYEAVAVAAGKGRQEWRVFGARGPAARFLSLRFVSLCGSGKYEDEGRLSGNLIWLGGLVSWCQGGLVSETAKVDL